MLIWSGLGLVVVLIAMLGMGAGGILAILTNVGGHIGSGLGLAGAGAVIWITGKKLNDKADEDLLNPETGEVVRLRHRNKHSLFFVPMQWWGPVAAVLGLLLAGGAVSVPDL